MPLHLGEAESPPRQLPWDDLPAQVRGALTPWPYNTPAQERALGLKDKGSGSREKGGGDRLFMGQSWKTRAGEGVLQQAGGTLRRGAGGWGPGGQ